MGSTLLRFMALLYAVCQVNALHFYFTSGEEPRCLQLDLGRGALLAEKHSAWELEESTQKWVRDDTLNIEVTITELFDNNHRVYEHKQSPFGDFQFVAKDGGEHRVCYRALSGSWWSKNKVKLEIDYVLGSDEILDSRQSGQVGTITDRIGDINRKLIFFHREQGNMRDREAAFRDQSEATNSKVSRLTLLQVVVIIGTCAWQVQHLRSFFTKQKLV